MSLSLSRLDRRHITNDHTALFLAFSKDSVKTKKNQCVYEITVIFLYTALSRWSNLRIFFEHIFFFFKKSE